MRFIKTYEEINQTDMPQVGDYLMDKNNTSRIGIIRKHEFSYYTVDYLDKMVSYFVDDNEVLYWSSNKEDLEPFLNAYKYNL